jgi:hypothetical protein
MPDAALAEAARQLPDAVLAEMLREQFRAAPVAFVPVVGTVGHRDPKPEKPRPTEALRREKRVPGRHVETPVQGAIVAALGKHRDGLTFSALMKVVGTGSQGGVFRACQVLEEAGTLTRSCKGAGAIWRLA